ncbi:MAG: hypothetical protein ABIN69_03210 [Aestuariivirga sp.]
MVIRLHSSLHHDAAWYIWVARGLLQGKQLYSDFIEVNPPLGMWLTVPVVWLANQLHADDTVVYVATLFVVGGLILVMIERLLRHAVGVGFKWLLLLSFAFVFFLLPGADFGEREQLIVLFFAPWLMLKAVPCQFNIAGRILAGVLAAAAIALKPQGIFAPLFVEALLVAQNRSWRGLVAAENLSALAATCAYGLMMALFTPRFFADVISLGRIAYLPYYGYPFYVVIFNARWAVVFALLAFIGWRNSATRIISVAGLGFAISYFLQDKGFTYQALPATAFALIACVARLAEDRNWKIPAVATGVLGVLMMGSEPLLYSGDQLFFARKIEEEAPAAKSIFIASTRLSDGFPLALEQKLIWASRLPTQWLVPYVADHLQSKEDRVVAKALDVTVNDIATLQPEIIFVDQSPDQTYVPGGKFDYVQFWMRDQRFAALWQNYRRRPDADHFTVYVRAK